MDFRIRSYHFPRILTLFIPTELPETDIIIDNFCGSDSLFELTGMTYFFSPAFLMLIVGYSIITSVAVVDISPVYFFYRYYIIT